MPKHASPVAPDLSVPAYYLTAATRDYPFLLLMEPQGDGYAAHDLPVAYGATLLYDARYPNVEAYGLIGSVCEACDLAVEADTGIAVEDGGEIPESLTAYHIPCLLSGDHLGLMTRSAVTLMEV